MRFFFLVFYYMSKKSEILKRAYEMHLDGVDKSEISATLGLTMKQISQKISRESKKTDNQERQERREPEEQGEQEEPEPEPEQITNVNVRPEPEPNVRTDAFLGGLGDDILAKFGGDIVEEPSFDPTELTKPAPQVEKKTGLAGTGKSASWWSKPSKPKALPEEERKEEEDKLVIVQKIRLYFHHFPDLEKLHIVTPNKDKFLIALYTKKQAELEKTLHFIQFHVRNQINEGCTTKLASTGLETAVRVLEMVLCTVGVKAKGLTHDVMADDDIQRCLKEILIEHGINTISYGPKADLAIKLGMKLAQKDAENRQLDYIESAAKRTVKKEESTRLEEVEKKYQDL